MLAAFCDVEARVVTLALLDAELVDLLLYELELDRELLLLEP
jgi:hypothetical protein